jgi:hypothetical protein
MHYLCGGGGSYELKLSQRDIDGHRSEYGSKTSPPPQTRAQPKLVLQFAGGLASENIVAVLMRLAELGLIHSTDYGIKPNDSFPKIFQQSPGLWARRSIWWI